MVEVPNAAGTPRSIRLYARAWTRALGLPAESVIAILIGVTALTATLFTWRAATLSSRAGKADERALEATTARQDALVAAESTVRQEMYFHARALGVGRASTRLAFDSTSGRLDPAESRALYSDSIDGSRLYEYIYEGLLPTGFLVDAPDAQGGLPEVFEAVKRRERLIGNSPAFEDVDPAVHIKEADTLRARSLSYGRGFTWLAAVIALFTLAECTRGRVRRRLAEVGAAALVATVALTLV